MQKKYFSIITLALISFLFTQNLNSYLWNGVSVSTSDNLDAIGLNPAGLGINRGEQFGLILKQYPIDLNNKYLFTYSRRTDWGLGLETTYDTFNEEFSGSIAYGMQLPLSTLKYFNQIFTGFKYSKNGDYSYGFLYRPLNGVSLGATNFKGNNIIKVCDKDQNNQELCDGSYYDT